MSSLTSNLRLLKKIGQGYFGEVFLAEDPVHGVVAVKRLQRDTTKSGEVWEARKEGLLREAQHLKQASHRNVVKVHHLLEEESGDAILFVMDFCSAGSLQAAFDEGPMSLSDLRKVATEVTHGLQALHGRGMLHRDIKPANLLRNEEGEVQLGDFGLVTDNLILGYGSQAGYWDHIAPEIHIGQGTSVKTDIWALGMTIFRLLHGVTWYSEHPRPVESVPEGGFAKGLRWLPHIPNKWRRFVRMMLHDDPSQRYQTATQVFAALSELPIQPDWKCRVSYKEIVWERLKRGRKNIVIWQRHSPRKHEWCAWGEPIGKGRKRKLGESNGLVSGKVAKQGLKTFFDSQT